MSAATYPDLRGQVVVVTGAARGIGRAVAIGFAEQGCVVVVNDLVADSAEDTVDACTRAGRGEVDRTWLPTSATPRRRGR